MSRRRKDDGELVELIVMFSELPLWVAPVGAALIYGGLEWAVPGLVGKTGPVRLMVAVLSTTVAPWLALAILGSGLVGALKRLGTRSGDKRVLNKMLNIETIRGLDWRDFERMLAAAYRDRGYQVTATARGADGGVDLVMKREGKTTYVQAKHWKARQVGVERLRELHGVTVADGVDNSILVCSGTVTPEAQAFAQRVGITVVDGNGLMPLIRPFFGGELPGAAPTACPICGGSMVERVARKGASAGSRFLGCSRYPRCRGTRQLIA